MTPNTSTDYIQNAQLSLPEKVVLEAMRAELLVIISADVSASETMQAAALATQYITAVGTPADYHMMVDTSLLGLSALAGGSNAAAQSARLNAMRTAIDTHALGVGSPTADGQHLAADTTNEATLAAVPAGSNTATNCTLAIALGAFAAAHGNQTGVHFHEDATLTGYTPSSNLLAGNATDAKCLIETNDLLAAFQTHFANGAGA